MTESAVVALRFEIKGWRPKNRASRLSANLELAEAQIMEWADAGFRFTPWSLEHREEILEWE